MIQQRRTPGRFFLLAVTTMIILVAWQAIAVCTVDPYGALGGTPKLWWHRQVARWRVPGIIRGNPGLKVVTIGTSMSEGFLPAMFDVEPHHYLNIAFPGATIEEQAIAIRFLLDHTKPERIIWELHPASFMIKERLRMAIPPLPEFLYGDSFADRLRYVLAPGTSVDIPGYLLAKANQPKTDVDTLVSWPRDPSLFSEQSIISDLCTWGPRISTYVERDPLILSKMESVVLPIVRDHPEIEFRFFTPAFSDLWYWMLTDQAFDGLVSTLSEVSGAISLQPNATFISMIGEPFIRDWANYKDVNHHDASVSAKVASLVTGPSTTDADAVVTEAEALKDRFPAISSRLHASAPANCAQRLAP